MDNSTPFIRSSSRRFPICVKTTLITTLLITLLFLSVVSPTTATQTESLNAYIPSTHKRLFEEFNTLVLGDLSVAKCAIRGALAVQGKAELADFNIGADKSCNPDVRALVVGRTLSARMGAISGGYSSVGRGSRFDHSVSMPCSNRVERYDAVRNGDVDFGAVRVDLIRETADLCMSAGAGSASRRAKSGDANGDGAGGEGKQGTVTTVNETMVFTPGSNDFSCYSMFRVSTADLRLTRSWRYAGDDYYRNLVIVVTGLRHEFREFSMQGFNPRRTLIVFCAIYGSFGIYNAKFHASILAPTSSFTTMEAIVNGSIIVGGLRGSIATLNVPYVTC